MAVCTLEGLADELQLWWTPSYIELLESHLVDEATKAATQGLASVDVCMVPLCKVALKTQLVRHCLAQATTQWHLPEISRDLHLLMPCFTQDVQWTWGLSRRKVSLIA